jgi:hypothetical protein
MKRIKSLASITSLRMESLLMLVLIGSLGASDSTVFAFERENSIRNSLIARHILHVAFFVQRTPKNMTSIRRVDQVCCCTETGGLMGVQCCAIGSKQSWWDSDSCTKFGLGTCDASWCPAPSGGTNTDTGTGSSTNNGH